MHNHNTCNCHWITPQVHSYGHGFSCFLFLRCFMMFIRPPPNSFYPRKFLPEIFISFQRLISVFSHDVQALTILGNPRVSFELTQIFALHHPPPPLSYVHTPHSPSHFNTCKVLLHTDVHHIHIHTEQKNNWCFICCSTFWRQCFDLKSRVTYIPWIFYFVFIISVSRG
jgi:hypothetical protein